MTLEDPAMILSIDMINEIFNYIPHSPYFSIFAVKSKRWRELLRFIMNSRIKISLRQISEAHAIRWHPVPMHNDFNFRLGVSTALTGHILYLFGGRTEDGTAMNDLSTFDLLTMKWNRLIPAGNRPLPRSDAIMGFVGEELYLFGGTRCIMEQPMSVHLFMIESNSLNDLFSYRQSTNSWNQLLKATESPRLSKYYSGVILQSIDSDPNTFPPLLIIFENTGLIYHTYAIELRGMYHWSRLSECPQNPPHNPAQSIGIDNPLNILPARPPMCALSETDVLMMTHFERNESPALWILSRMGRTPQSVIAADGWSWTEVKMIPGLNTSNVFLNQPNFLLNSKLICLPVVQHAKTEDGDQGENQGTEKGTTEKKWPTVALLSHLPLSNIRAHLSRRIRTRPPRRPPPVQSESNRPFPSARRALVPDPLSLSPIVLQNPNPLVTVFDELPDLLRTEGSEGQPLRGIIIPRTLQNPTSIISSSRPRRSRRQPAMQRSSSSGGEDQINDFEADSEPEILAIYTLKLNGDIEGSSSSTLSQPLSGIINGPSDRDYHSDNLPISRSFSAFAYGLGSLLVFGVPQTSLVEVENDYEMSSSDRRLIVWNITGRGLVCGYDAPV
ncbi:unnamed protein product [Hymenolepis diminuta]|uniref:F-box domain-containing protein n=1 Tax=Hymenolepis diminuta TaxID=6216 RepID=A0A564YL51_HYMDI|nr:unnamed protein product [Hymenolepis diminuta]